MKKYMYLFIYIFFASLNFNLILKPLHLVTGGTNSLAIILNYIFNIKAYLLVLIINTVMIIISIFFLEKSITLSALISSFLYPLFIKITSACIYFDVNILLKVVIAGIIYGITTSCIFNLGFSSGGITILILFINKYTKIKKYIINFFINFILIIIGTILFGISNLFYSLLVLIIGTVIINFLCDKKKI